MGCFPCSCMWYSSGTGMFEADSLSRWSPDPCELPLLCKYKVYVWAYPVARLYSSLFNGFHDTPLLVRHIAYPI